MSHSITVDAAYWRSAGQDKVFGSTQMGEVHSYLAAEGVDDRIADRMGLLAFQLFSSVPKFL